MKKLLLLAAVSALGFTAMAQTEKGKMILGGTVQYYTDKSDQYLQSFDLSPITDVQKTTGFTIMPSIGYFIANNFALGTGIGYNQGKGTQNYSYNYVPSVNYSKNHSFTINPFARYYLNIIEQVKLFGNFSVPIAFTNSKNSPSTDASYDRTYKSTNIGVALSPGLVFFPTPKFGIEFSVNGLSYGHKKLTSNDDFNTGGTSKSFDIGGNFSSPAIGVQYYF